MYMQKAAYVSTNLRPYLYMYMYVGETEKMMKMVGQYIILQNILDLAKQSRVPPHITMGPFFTRMKVRACVQIHV